MKILKIAGIVFLSLIVLLVLTAVIAKYSMDANYFKGYNSAADLRITVGDVQDRGAYTRTHLYFDGYRGQRVPTLFFLPNNATTQQPVPCVIFLHGIGQHKEFVDEQYDGKTVAEVFLNQGFAFVTFDQYMQGERKLPKEASKWDQAMAFRNRPRQTIMDARRLIDYLETRPEIAKDRIYLAGASYGAITGSTVAAFDKRISAVVLTYGGGDLSKMLYARMVAKELGALMPVAQVVAWMFLDVMDPVRYAKDISPRPVFLQNGTDDCLIATPAAKALQDAVREPKKVKIYPGDHIGLDKNTVVVVLNDIIEFLKEQDRKVAKAQPELKAAG